MSSILFATEKTLSPVGTSDNVIWTLVGLSLSPTLTPTFKIPEDSSLKLVANTPFVSAVPSALTNTGSNWAVLDIFTVLLTTTGVAAPS